MTQLTVEQALQTAVQHHQSGQLRQAETLYRQILAREPNHADALHHLGVLAAQVGRIDTAPGLIHKAIALRPNWPEAHFDLGIALNEVGRLDESIAAYRRAIALKPAYAEAHENLGNTLKDHGQLDESLSSYRRAIELRPNHVDAHDNLLYLLHFLPSLDAGSIAEEHRRWHQKHASPLKHFIQPHDNDPNPDRRLRIGYVSADFCQHASAHFLVPLMHCHDAQQVELFCYAEVAHPDAITHRLREKTAGWRNTLGYTDEQVARQIHEDRIDILVDLKLHSARNRLLVFARKPAPVQVTWLGYPGTTGLETIDYRLSDPWLDPPGMDESVYSERTLRLPDSYWCYDPLDQDDIRVNALPALRSAVTTFGCLNNFCKINDDVLSLWAKVLRQVDDSRLLLKAGAGSHRQKALEFMVAQGVKSEQVEFVMPRPRREYLQLYHQIDIGLDCFPCNGHTTSFDSLWMGVPVVSLVGKTAMGRAGLSLLSNVGLPELAVRSEEEYVRCAIGLAGDHSRLSALRSTLRQRMEKSPLMDSPRFARSIESAYRHMWRQWCSNQSHP